MLQIQERSPRPPPLAKLPSIVIRKPGVRVIPVLAHTAHVATLVWMAEGLNMEAIYALAQRALTTTTALGREERNSVVDHKRQAAPDVLAGPILKKNK